MTKLICTAPDIAYGKYCGGEVEKVKAYFCLKCKRAVSAGEILKQKEKPVCHRCKKELIVAKEYICKKCKTRHYVVEVK